VRYIRYRLKINAPVNWHTASDSRWASKIIILGNTCENGNHQPTRVIQMLRGPGDSVWNRAQLDFSQNIDTGGPSAAGPLRAAGWSLARHPAEDRKFFHGLRV